MAVDIYREEHYLCGQGLPLVFIGITKGASKLREQENGFIQRSSMEEIDGLICVILIILMM